MGDLLRYPTRLPSLKEHPLL